MKCPNIKGNLVSSKSSLLTYIGDGFQEGIIRDRIIKDHKATS